MWTGDSECVESMSSIVGRSEMCDGWLEGVGWVMVRMLVCLSCFSLRDVIFNRSRL